MAHVSFYEECARVWTWFEYGDSGSGEEWWVVEVAEEVWGR